jgi:ferredoxin
MRADGNCRACVVEIKGERTLAPSCCRNVTAGLEVLSQSLRARKSQEMVLELLLSDMPDQGHKWTEAGQHGELSDWAQALDVKVRPELQSLRREQARADVSHPAMAVNLDACIQCNRCVLACREEQVNEVIGYAHRGAHSQIVFDLQDDMGSSSCVACGECVQACPTGALMPAPAVQDQAPVIEGPKPSALAPLAVNPAKKAQPTVVIEADNSVFDLNEAIFIYTGNVRARHPDFYIECEELEVYMVKEESKKASGATTPKVDPKKSADPDLMKRGPDKNPIKKAIARGPMVTIEKRDEQGNVQQGKCRRLDYDQATGDITLSDYPQVQRGNVLHIATQADTTMVFDKTGKLRTNGRPRTVILSDEPAPLPGTVPPATKPQSR